MSISVAWGGRIENMESFETKANLQLWRPRELLLLQLLQIAGRHSVHDAHAKLEKENMQAVKLKGDQKKDKAKLKLIIVYVVALVLGSQQGSASLLHLLGHGHHAGSNVPGKSTQL